MLIFFLLLSINLNNFVPFYSDSYKRIDSGSGFRINTNMNFVCPLTQKSGRNNPSKDAFQLEID